MLYFLYQTIRVYYQNNGENLLYFFLTPPISSVRNFLPFCLPQFDESNIYIPPSSIFSRYTSRTFPLLLSLIFFVPFHIQFSTPLPFLLFTPPLVLTASNRPALSTTGSPVTSSLSSTEAGVFFFPGAASREFDKRTSRPESRWRDRREGQISDGIAAEKRHLMLDCLSSLSLFLVTFTSSKPGSIVATSRRDKMNPIVSPGGIIMNAHSPRDTK